MFPGYFEPEMIDGDLSFYRGPNFKARTIFFDFQIAGLISPKKIAKITNIMEKVAHIMILSPTS